VSVTRGPDWPLLLARGGQFHIWNPLHAWDKNLASKYTKNISETGPIPDWFKGNSVGGFWWGEGDEKFPSAFGTGSNVGASRPDCYSRAAG
jgi:hypothetical protein